MGRRSKKGRPNADLEDFINRLLREVQSGTDGEGKKYSLTDKVKVIDRGLKMAAINAKLDDPGYGSGFSDPSED